MPAVIWIWLRSNRLQQKYGLCAFRGDAGRYLYFLPLALIASTNLWRGTALSMPLHETLLYMLSMLCVGFLEEIIFRGFLFRALMDEGNRHAIWISGLTFGFGHIVNLLNGAEFLPTMLQICYAAAIGVLFTVLFYRSGSLIPCIITHSVVNALSAISRDVPGLDVPIAVFLMIVPLAYAAWIWKKTA